MQHISSQCHIFAKQSHILLHNAAYSSIKSHIATQYHILTHSATYYILLWCVSPRFLGDTPLLDNYIVVYHLSVELFFVLTYLIKIP